MSKGGENLIGSKIKHKILPIFIVIGCLFIQGCGEKDYPVIAIENLEKLITVDRITSQEEYRKHISNLDNWCVGTAYDELIVVPQDLLEEDDGTYFPLNADNFEMYALYKKITAEDFYNMYHEQYETLTSNIAGDTDDSGKISSDVSASSWYDMVKEKLNPKGNTNIDEAIGFLAYGNYTVKWGKSDIKYFTVVVFNSEGKVSEFVTDYLGVN